MGAQGQILNLNTGTYDLDKTLLFLLNGDNEVEILTVIPRLVGRIK